MTARNRYTKTVDRCLGLAADICNRPCRLYKYSNYKDAEADTTLQVEITHGKTTLANHQDSPDYDIRLMAITSHRLRRQLTKLSRFHQHEHKEDANSSDSEEDTPEPDAGATYQHGSFQFTSKGSDTDNDTK